MLVHQRCESRKVVSKKRKMNKDEARIHINESSVQAV